MKVYEISLPPSVNSCYTAQGKFLSKEARAWKAFAKYELYRQRAGDKTIEAPCRIVQDFYFKDNRRRDTSNYYKMLHDAIVNAGIIKDDSLIFEEHALKVIDRTINSHKVFFSVTELEE